MKHDALPNKLISSKLNRKSTNRNYKFIMHMNSWVQKICIMKKQQEPECPEPFWNLPMTRRAGHFR